MMEYTSIIAPPKDESDRFAAELRQRIDEEGCGPVFAAIAEWFHVQEFGR